MIKRDEKKKLNIIHTEIVSPSVCMRLQVSSRIFALSGGFLFSSLSSFMACFCNAHKNPHTFHLCMYFNSVCVCDLHIVITLLLAHGCMYIYARFYPIYIEYKCIVHEPEYASNQLIN